MQLANSIWTRSLNDVLWQLKDATSYLNKSPSDVYLRVVRCRSAVRTYRANCSTNQYERIHEAQQLLGSVNLQNVDDSTYVDQILNKVWNIFVAFKQENAKSYLT